MKVLVENIARALVDHPDEISVSADGDTVHLHVAPGDLGRVIGRQGRTARAFRTVVATAGSKANRRTVLEIVE